MEMRKKYAVFAGMGMSPGWGWQDFCGATNSIDEARKLAAQEAPDKEWDFWQIVDLDKLEIVEEN